MAAALGNKNALKHGLYAKRLTGTDGKTVKALSHTDIRGEIAYLRIVIARLSDILENNGLSQGATNLLSDEGLKHLNSYGLALERLATLIRTHALLNGEASEFEKEIEEGRFLARTYYGVFEYLQPKTKKRPRSKS